VLGDGVGWLEVDWGVIGVVVGEGPGVGWLLEVREVGQGRIIIVIAIQAWGCGHWPW
jgi:hypothetical protein